MRKVLWILTAAIAFGACDDGTDLRAPARPPVGVPPDIHGRPSDGSMPAASNRPANLAGRVNTAKGTVMPAAEFEAWFLVETGRRADILERSHASQPGSVERVSSAIIGANMHSCFVAPTQANGDVAALPSTYSNQCLLMAPNYSWDLCSPTLHYYDNTLMNDRVGRLGGFTCFNRCIAVEYWEHDAFVGQSQIAWGCAGAGQCVNILVDPAPFGVSSVQTYHWTN